MLIRIFGEDDAGIGPAGPRCGTGPWAANGENLESIGPPGDKLRPSSPVDRRQYLRHAEGEATGMTKNYMTRRHDSSSRAQWGTPLHTDTEEKAKCLCTCGSNFDAPYLIRPNVDLI